MSSAKTMRRARIGQIASLILNVGALVFNALVGSIMVIFPIVCILVLMAAIYVQTKTIRRREELDRPRPDYSAIARMEREVYGEAFEHEGGTTTFGSLVPVTALGGVTMAEFGENMKAFAAMTTRPVTCRQGHPDQLWVQERGQVCPQCDRKRNTSTNAVTFTGNASSAPMGGGAGGTSETSCANDCDSDGDEHRSDLRWDRPS